MFVNKQELIWSSSSAKEKPMIKDYTCVDIETTGVSPEYSHIIEIGAVKVRDGQVVDTFSELIDPGIPIPYFITNLTGITDEMVAGKETIDRVLPRFIEFAGDDVLLGHNLRFDFSFLKQKSKELKLEFQKLGIDTLRIARKKYRSLPSRKLDDLCEFFGIDDPDHHRAFNDADVTSKLYLIFCENYQEDDAVCFEPVQMQYKPRKKQPITPKQKKYLLNLISYHNLEVDYDVDNLSKSEASRKIDQIISSKGKIMY